MAHVHNLDIQEAEIRRMGARSQPKQRVHETLSPKYPSQKRAGGVAQGVGPEFKPSTEKKKIYSKGHLRSGWVVRW
jgi:hypothetical protein